MWCVFANVMWCVFANRFANMFTNRFANMFTNKFTIWVSVRFQFQDTEKLFGSVSVLFSDTENCVVYLVLCLYKSYKVAQYGTQQQTNNEQK